MNPIQMVLDGVNAAVALAKAVINAFAKSEEERQAHLAELERRLDVRVYDVDEAAAKTAKALDSLPPVDG